MMQSSPPPKSTEEGHIAEEQELGLIPIYIAATVGGLIIVSFLVRVFLAVYRSVKASLPPRAREGVVALHQLVLVS
jgi:hypothetical protein